MGGLTRAFNWADTSLGAPNQWPQPLQTMVSVLLNARFPMFLWWGPDLIQFYNDGYRPSLGDPGKHPAALGQRAEACWPEIWTTIKPLIDQVLGGGEATWQEDQLVPIYRNGHLEDVYLTFSYSPVPDETGRPGGVLVTCTETTGQVLIRQQLTASREQLRRLIEEAPVAMALFSGTEFIITLANERVLEFWNRSREEVIDKPLFAALPEAGGQGFEALLMRVYTTGERFVAEELPVTLERNGRLEQTYINFVYEPYHEIDGTISGIIVVCVEITEQVLARRKLQDEQNRLNTILNEMPIGVLMATATGELVYGNRQVEQIFRHPFRESRDIEAYANWQLFDPATDQPFPLEQMPMVRTLRHGETVTGVEMKLLRGDNTWAYASVNTVPVYDSTGQLQYGVSAFVDVSEQKRAEAALGESELKYRTLFNEMDEGYGIAEVLVNDAGEPCDYRILEVNPQLERLTGMSRELLLSGQTMRQIAPEVEEKWYRLYGNVALTGEPLRAEELTQAWNRWYDVYVFRIGNPELRRIAVFYKEITERKRREANLAFLAEIADEFTRQLSTGEIMQTVGAKIGQYMNVASVNFLDIDESEEKELTVSYFWGKPGVPILLGQYHIRDFLTEEFERACRAGETYVINDTQTDPRTDAAAYASLAIGAYVNVPFHHQSRWTNIMAITDTQARMWRADEIELFSELANRIFPRLQRTRAEDSLRRQETRTRIALESAEMGTWEWNLLTNEVYWNDQHFWLFGMELMPQPITPNEFTQHVHPDDLDRIKADLERTIREKTVYDAEFRAVRDDGTIRCMSGYGRVTAEIDGRATRLSGVMFDIDDRKRADERLRRSDEQLRIVMESITDHALITTDTQRKITGWNPGAQSLFGFTPEEALGQLEDIIFTPEDRASGAPRQEMETARRDGKAFDERYHIRKDGSRLYVSGVQSPLYTGNGTLLGYVKVARDLTERRQMEQALRQADQRKDEFLATLAHELRNPLAPIRNILQILTLTADGNETVTSSVDLMIRQVDQLVRLIDDLLDVSRISRGTVQLRPERIDLRTVVGQAVDASRPLYQADGRTLTVELPPAPVYIQGDMTRLIQVVSNLLNNAAKFTNEGGRVWLTLERVDGESNPNTVRGRSARTGRYAGAGPASPTARLRVRDDGIGIAPNQLERIFDLFAQADTTLERSRNGLGLGLTLVRQLVELHGGRVMAHSKGLGQGSEFTIYLPALAEPPKPQPVPNTAAKQPTGGRQVLVIDDNRDAATTLAMLLKLKGYQAHARYSGQEGVSAAESLRPEVVLLDIGMPGLNGYDTCRLIREQPWGHSMVLIALTGYGQEEDKRLSREAGFDSHLVKPVDLAALLQLLASLPASRSENS